LIKSGTYLPKRIIEDVKRRRGEERSKSWRGEREGKLGSALLRDYFIQAIRSSICADPLRGWIRGTGWDARYGRGMRKKRKSKKYQDSRWNGRGRGALRGGNSRSEGLPSVL